MPYKPLRKIKSLDGITPNSQVRQAASRFPAVGMTLPSYNVYTGDARAGRQAVVQPRTGWLAGLRRKFTKKRVIIALVILILLPGLWLGGKLVYEASRIFRGNIFSALTTTKLKGEDQGRVNILLAGNSADDPGHQGASLTDSIMILSINTKDNSAFMLSVPRDLWVNIPGYGHHKINEAYNDGEDSNFKESDYPKGGMGLLEKVIHDNFGLNIQYYSLIDYKAFRQAVDAVGGIDVNIQSVDSRGLYDPNIAKADGGPLKLRNGMQHLDGRTALNFARARGDSYYSYGFPASDFDRTSHQRQMLLALKAKMFSNGVIANPIALSKLMDALGANVKTDLQLSEVRRVSDVGKKIGNNNIKSLSLNSADGKNLLDSYMSPSGESALIPAKGIDDFSAIQQYIRKMTSDNPIVKENANVVILNGTDTFGLAGKNAKTLETKGLTISQTADAMAVQATTQIINTSGTKKPATLKLLQLLYGTNITATNPYAGKYNVDFIIVLGNDQLSTKSN
jgi:LCP family protein required for cell wall assembly